MMESEVAAPDDNVLNEIIAAEDLKRIPEDVCKKLQNAFVEKCSELNAIKALLATNRNIFGMHFCILFLSGSSFICVNICKDISVNTNF